jgi:Zn-dependent protease with chaperone function
VTAGESSRAQDESEVRRRTLLALAKPIPAPRLTLAYRLAVSVVGILMLLLPLVYLGIVALACFGLYYHATEHTGILTGSLGGFRLLAYVVPLLGGGILILFMFKPLLARSRPATDEKDVTAEDQPQLFEVLHALCEAMNAPRPRRVVVNTEMNASASLQGLLGGVLGGRLTLTIGLPLAGGVTVSQFVGVLAHELGRFAQGVGMRMSHVIGWVNDWFARVVHGRDRWDEKLVLWANGNSNYLLWTAILARLLVWLTRLVLLGLMWVARAMSCFLSREMEYDADHYQIWLSGTEEFAPCHLELEHLAVASHHARSALASGWEEKRLVDDLPGLIFAHRQAMAPSLVAELDEFMGNEEKSIFDTHPRWKDRIARARHLDVPGVLHIDAPATVLFSRWEEMCREVTFLSYRQPTRHRVRREHLISVADFQGHEDQEDREREALIRFFPDGLTHLRALPLSPTLGARPEPLALEEARRRVRDERPDFEEALEAYADDADHIAQVRAAMTLLDCGCSVDATDFELDESGPEACLRKIEELKRRVDDLTGRLAGYERHALERLDLSLGLLHSPAIMATLDDGEALRREAADLRRTAGVLGDLLSEILIWSDRIVLGAHLNREADWQAGDASFQKVIRRQVAGLRKHLKSVREDAKDTPHPFEQGAEPTSIGRFLVPRMPRSGDATAVTATAAGALCLDRIQTLYSRTMGRLAWIGEQAEAGSGLDPLTPTPTE